MFDAPNAVRIELTNPLVDVTDEPEAISIYSGALAALEDQAPQYAPSFPPVDLDDGIAIRLELSGTLITKVRAFRSLTTSFDLYYLTPAPGSLLLTDSFRAALSAIPHERRQVPQNAIIDQLLFRTCPGTSSLVAGVGRLGHGELLEWDLRSRNPTVTRAARLDRYNGGRVNVQEELQRRLDRVMRPHVRQPSSANMLSGGIDSTLLQTFLPSGSTSVSAAIDLPEYAFEVDYARRASELTGSSHQLVRVAQNRFLEHLENCIDHGGLPPHHLQTVLFDRVFLGKFDRYLTAQLADALFGLERARWASQARLGRVLWNAPGIGTHLIKHLEHLGTRAEGHAALLRQLKRDLEDPYGFASMYAVYSDVDAVVRLFGTDPVRARMSARLEYTADCLNGNPPDDPVDAHLELGQLLDFFCDDGISIWRQLAQGRGKYLASPFTSRTIVETSFQVPASHRYARLGREKPALKELLSTRLPAYPVDQPKGASGLPFGRLYPEGSLRGIFDRYSPPDFLDRDAREACMRGGGLSWNVIGYTVWWNRIVANQHLPTPEYAFQREWKTIPEPT